MEKEEGARIDPRLCSALPRTTGKPARPPARPTAPRIVNQRQQQFSAGSRHARSNSGGGGGYRRRYSSDGLSRVQSSASSDRERIKSSSPRSARERVQRFIMAADLQTGNGQAGKGLQARFFMAIMASVGIGILYGFKVNLSINIVAMVNHTALSIPSQDAGLLGHNVNGTWKPQTLNSTSAPLNGSLMVKAPPTTTTEKLTDGPFVWDERIQGLILGSYFWGYMASLMPGGMVAEYVSAKWVLNGAVLLNAIPSLMMPYAASFHYGAFIALRVIQGLGGGISFPAIHVLVSRWAPPNERSLLASIAYAGTALGTVIFILWSGMIAATLGWEWVFYIEGAACFIWCTAWGITVKDTPEEQKMIITDEERDYILKSQGNNKDKHKVKLSEIPWFKILTSMPFIAILVAHFCSNFGWYMLLIELPKFMNQILKYDLKENTWLSALPYFLMWIFTISLSKGIANMHNKNWISVTVSRKIGTLFATAVPMFCLLGASYAENKNIVVGLMTIGITCCGGMFSGFLANHIDLAPNFAGTLVAITNTIATIPGIIVPIIVGSMTHNNETKEAWKTIFLMTCCLYIIAILIYTMFGTGAEQPWNKVHEKPEETPLRSSRRNSRERV